MTETTLNILNDAQLSKVSGGQEYVSDENALRNVLNYYIDLLPFTSRKHIRIKYNADNWTRDSDNENLFKRNITQIYEINDMKWNALSKTEKRQVIIPVVGVGFIAGFTGLSTLVRYLSNHSSN